MRHLVLCLVHQQDTASALAPQLVCFVSVWLARPLFQGAAPSMVHWHVAWPRSQIASWADSAVFFRSVRASFGATSVVGSDVWIMLAGSCSGGVASTFLRDRVFLILGCSDSERGGDFAKHCGPVVHFMCDGSRRRRT